jgi:hypothetical protein
MLIERTGKVQLLCSQVARLFIPLSPRKWVNSTPSLLTFLEEAERKQISLVLDKIALNPPKWG